MISMPGWYGQWGIQGEIHIESKIRLSGSILLFLMLCLSSDTLSTFLSYRDGEECGAKLG